MKERKEMMEQKEYEKQDQKIQKSQIQTQETCMSISTKTSRIRPSKSIFYSILFYYLKKNTDETKMSVHKQAYYQ